MRLHPPAIGLIVLLCQSNVVQAQHSLALPSARQQSEAVFQSDYEQRVSKRIAEVDKTTAAREAAARRRQQLRFRELRLRLGKAATALPTRVSHEAEEGERKAKLKRLHEQLRGLEMKRAEFNRKGEEAVGEKDRQKVEALGKMLEKAEREIKEQIREITEDNGHDNDWNPEAGAEEKRFEREVRTLRIELEELSDKYGSNHPKVVALRKKIEAMVRSRERDGRRDRHHQEHEERRRDEEAHERELKNAHHRMEGLREAAEQLHASGVHDVAERLQHEAEEIERHLHRQHGEDPAHELHEQMQELRKELHELHRKLDHVLEFIEKAREEESDDEENEANLTPEDGVFRGQKLFNVQLIKFESEETNRSGTLDELREREKTWSFRLDPATWKRQVDWQNRHVWTR